ncbi:MAG TPA: hypothetical protein LFV91_02140 [Rickettsia endosymbiont of Bembidion nr. Transversale]|nr:hypothetical protein [Rickettsia endosymbiont of Bembidion nr. Transversale]
MRKKDLMNISLENILDNSDVFTSINLEESFVEASNSFFTNFYNTAVYAVVEILS